MSRTNDDILAELHTRYDYGTTEWEPHRKEGDRDMRALAGDPWDPKDRSARELANRPCLSLDELGQYTNSIVNEVRANKRAIQVEPRGNGANDKTAALRAARIRQIEYDSHAQEAYTVMFENAVQRGYGFCRVVTKYYPGTFNQYPCIEPIHNPNLVTMDPDALKATASDAQWCFVEETWRHEEFKRRFPKARTVGFSNDVINSSHGWVTEQTLRLAEYWTLEKTQKTLVAIKPQAGMAPIMAYLEDFPKGHAPKAADILQSRTEDVPQVIQYLTNGVEILQTTKWAGKSLPIVACYGKVLYFDDGAGTTRRLMSMIRLARDPYMLYCYYRTCEAELVGMTPKFPYFVYEGQMSPSELVTLQKSLHEPVAVVQVKATIEGLQAGQVLGFPARQPYEPPIQGLEIGAESARRAIQAAMGQTSLPTAAQRRSEKSGIALEKIADQMQRGSYHFIDHYEDSLREVGVKVNDLLSTVEDTARDEAVRSLDGVSRILRVNDPTTPDDEQYGPADMTVGDHSVTISTGPSFDSEREAGEDFVDLLVSNLQTIAPLLGPEKSQKLLAKSIKLKNIGPVGDDIVEMIDPPDESEVDAEQLKAKLAEATQGIQQMTEALKQLEQEREADLIKQQTDIQKAQIDANTKIRIAEIQINADLFIQDAKDRAAANLTAQKAADADRDREDTQRHEMALKAADAAQQSAQAERSHEQDLEGADIGHAHTLEQQAAKPEPKGASA